MFSRRSNTPLLPTLLALAGLSTLLTPTVTSWLDHSNSEPNSESNLEKLPEQYRTLLKTFPRKHLNIKIVDGQGHPVNSAIVNLTIDTLPDIPLTFRADCGGHVDIKVPEVDFVLDSRVILNISHPDYRTYCSEHSLETLLGNSNRDEHLKVSLLRAPSLQVRIVDETGAPIEGADVTAFSAVSDLGPREASEQSYSTETDASGRALVRLRSDLDFMALEVRHPNFSSSMSSICLKGEKAFVETFSEKDLVNSNEHLIQLFSLWVGLAKLPDTSRQWKQPIIQILDPDFTSSIDDKERLASEIASRFSLDLNEDIVVSILAKVRPRNYIWPHTINTQIWSKDIPFRDRVTLAISYVPISKINEILSSSAPVTNPKLTEAHKSPATASGLVPLNIRDAFHRQLHLGTVTLYGEAGEVIEQSLLREPAILVNPAKVRSVEVCSLGFDSLYQPIPEDTESVNLTMNKKSL